MRAFAALYAELDASTSTQHKIDALERYLRRAPPEDAAWAVYVLAGGKTRQAVPTRVLREAAREVADLPEWLFDECHQAVGDLAETIAHLLPAPGPLEDVGLALWMDQRLPALREAEPPAARALLRGWWAALDWQGRFLLGKLITGGLRVGLSRQGVIRALAAVSGLPATQIAQRMIGWTDPRARPDAERLRVLLAPAAEPVAARARGGTPYPFFLAHALQSPPEALGPAGDWLAEWKWDGIRAQLVMRTGEVWLWSRGEELVTDRFPEIAQAARVLAAAADADGAGLVLDGELLAWAAGAPRPLPFATLQTRVTRRSLSAAVRRACPVSFVAYDLLERHGEDCRGRPLAERRAGLQQLLAAGGDPRTQALRLSPTVPGDGWAERAALREQSRARGVEGLMLKRLSAGYGVGRTLADGGDWWKWKVDPFTVDAVLVYAQRGHGRRASLYTDYTFAVWDRAASPSDPGPRTLMPFAKAYSGLTDAQIRQVDAIVRRTTVESFGPVRSVTPSLVFELGFEGVARSPRHKSGIAVRFPRMLRWRTDKAADQADSLEVLHRMLDAPPADSPADSAGAVSEAGRACGILGAPSAPPADPETRR
jgi:DNA ligase-1